MIFFLKDVIAKEFVNASNRAHTHEICAQLVTEGMGIGSPDDPKNCKSLRLFAISEWQVHGGTRESESLSPPRALLAIFVDWRVALRQVGQMGQKYGHKDTARILLHCK